MRPTCARGRRASPTGKRPRTNCAIRSNEDPYPLGRPAGSARRFRFYEAQQQGLGVYFLDTLIADIDSLQLFAGIHPVVAGGYQRLLAKRFPFAVYHRREDLTVLIYAILDCRRNPAWNRKRLRIATSE